MPDNDFLKPLSGMRSGPTLFSDTRALVYTQRAFPKSGLRTSRVMKREKLTKTEARQGVETKYMRYVLAGSLSLSVVAMILVMASFT